MKPKITKSEIYTIGHSNRTADDFLSLLGAFGIKKIVDVRTIPKSRHNPQFNKDALRASLKKAGIEYRHLAKLGGLRRASKDSKNLGWRNSSFRGFADYMSTPEFAEGLSELEKIARVRKTAVMCAEAVPWRCHRSLIADALVKKGWVVRDIMSKTKSPRHHLTPFLRMMKGRIIYPPILPAD